MAADESHLIGTIDKIAIFVARNGPEFERMLKEKQQQNELFYFLFGGPFHEYYIQKVREEQEKMIPEASYKQPTNLERLQFSIPSQPSYQLQFQHPPPGPLHQIPNNEFLVDLPLEEFDAILETIMHHCTKSRVQAGRKWILENCRNQSNIHQSFSLLVNKILNSITGFESKLSLLYLVNDLVLSAKNGKSYSNCEQINAWILDEALIAIGPMFLSVSQLCHGIDENIEKLAKLIGIWEKKSIFPESFLENIRRQFCSKYAGSESSNYLQQPTELSGSNTLNAAPVQLPCQPCPGSFYQPIPNQCDPNSFKNLQNEIKRPYYDLPAGLMMNLVKPESMDYEALDPEELEIPPPQPATDRLLSAIEAFYSAPSHEQPRDSLGWEKNGLYEFMKWKLPFLKGRKRCVSTISLPFSPTKILNRHDNIVVEQNLESSKINNKVNNDSIHDKVDKPTSFRRVFFEKPTDSPCSSMSVTPSESDEDDLLPTNLHSDDLRSDKPPNSPVLKFRRSPTPPDTGFIGFSGTVSTVASLDTAIDSSNIGHKMLKKMGWEGSGLGREEKGIQEPIKPSDTRDLLEKYKGVGATNAEDVYEQFRRNRSSRFGRKR